MSVWKKVVAGVVVTSLIAGAGYYGLNYMRRSRETEVLVVSVDSIAVDYYSENTTLDGTITTNVSQHVSMDKDMVVDTLYVSKGEEVHIGDPLISFDMTLVNMELEIAKLKQQKLEIDLQKAQKRLTSLRNGGPIDESDTDTLASAGDASFRISDDGIQLAAAVRPFLLTAALYAEPEIRAGSSDSEAAAEETDGTDTQTVQEETEDSRETVQEGGSETGETGETGADPTEEEPTDSGSETTDPEDPFLDDDFSLEDNDFQFSTLRFYQILDDTSEPYAGTGTQEDPYLFLVSSATGQVTALGSFLNKMAGYSADGATELHPGGYWYLLEFHAGDTIADPLHREDSCIGYYLIDGSLLEGPISMFAEMDYTQADASLYENEEIIDPNIDIGSGSSSTMSRSEAIKAQETKVRSLELDIQEGLINLNKLEKKAATEVVYSRLEGTIADVGDPITGSTASNGSFLTVKSKEGYYVKGNISELLLDELETGTRLDCMSYTVGKFEAEVIDVSDYPESSSNYYYYGGDSNPNVSYYSFSASLDDQTLELSDGDWVTITLKTDASKSNRLVIPKAFVRSENGKNYVYKSVRGVLKKQYIKVGENVDGGYSVMIREGLTRDDLIAFPYGDDTKDGAQTKRGTISEMYDE